jgi:hypothetical protein
VLLDSGTVAMVVASLILLVAFDDLPVTSTIGSTEYSELTFALFPATALDDLATLVEAFEVVSVT